MAPFANMNLTAASTCTLKTLDWHPTEPGLIEDLENRDYALIKK
ncbi:hypothetical protein GCM10027285_10200 [Oleiagrimonas citrea]